MGHRSQGNEWRTVGGPHALVFLEANQPRQSLVDPGINHGFEPDYGFETGRRARRRPAPEGSQGRGARPRMSWAHQRARYVLRQPELQVGGVAYRCPIEFRHQVARLEPGTRPPVAGRPGGTFWTLV